MPEVEHIVLWPFKDASDLVLAAQAIKSVAAKALHNGEPYILSIKCGTTRPCLPVRSHGFNLASIVQFRCEEDRRYFVQEDPAHKELIQLTKDKLASGILVLDFIDDGIDKVPIAEC
ncbi:hypothetical protein N7520_003282 [Penicillium odoratum]|uniref:uncharacterized protein n=1 Tax=Penicillium odoratum TaxID=1167516 RepID=UPI002548EB89|nr:uncharacterized protein N7520_003282 [Penicillium odoratum]KAJ5768723.1 hypothetical protein N7520_003282 [Penicillium odoratum]